MPSKPIDPMCPVRLVSAEMFSRMTSVFEESDFHWHDSYHTLHSRRAYWNWDEGCWWVCDGFDAFSRLIGVLFDAESNLDDIL